MSVPGLDPRMPRLSRVKRPLRIAIGLVLTALAFAYILLKIDVGQTWDVLTSADLVVVRARGHDHDRHRRAMALRWKWLLAAQGIHDRLAWLTRAYFVSYTAGQILPTSIGGDAVRIFETAKRHPGRSGDLTAIVLLERGLGGAATVLLGAIGFVLALGQYDVGAYLWLEGAFVFGTMLLIVVFFSRSARPLLARLRPLLVRVRARAPAAGVLRRRPPLPRSPAAAAEGLRLHDGDPGGARSSRSGPRAGRWGSSSGRGSTT